MYAIGIDEVGRGALAGPIVVTALALPLKSNIPRLSAGGKYQISRIKPKLKDSKKLSPKQREVWFQYVKNYRISYAIASVSPKIIDKINISKAANLAATRATKRLLANKKLASKNIKVFLDGGLYLNNKTLMANGYSLNSKTIIKGDEKIDAIKLTSIVAKVTRDRYMVKLHKLYPQYGFDVHKGYGTKRHMGAIKKHGYSDAHRKSFRVKQ